MVARLSTLRRCEPFARSPDRVEGSLGPTASRQLASRQAPVVSSGDTRHRGQGLVWVRHAATLIPQIALLWVASDVGHEAVEFAHLPLPGNVAGMLVMFVALSCGVLPLRFVEEGAGLLVRNLPLFFVPMAVGFLTQGHLLATHGVAIAVALIGSLALGFAVTGRVAQYVMGYRRRETPGKWTAHATTHRSHL